MNLRIAIKKNNKLKWKILVEKLITGNTSCKKFNKILLLILMYLAVGMRNGYTVRFEWLQPESLSSLIVSAVIILRQSFEKWE